MTDQDTTPKMLTVAEVAAMLRISEKTVRRHIMAGRVRGAVDVGAGQVPRYQIPESEVPRIRRELRA